MSIQQEADESVPISVMLTMAIEGWRFARAYIRLIEKLDMMDQSRYLNQHRYYLKQLDEQLQSCGMRLVDLEGHAFDAGMAATAINLPDFEPDDTLVVDQMLEPVIMGPTGLIKMGTVLLRKAGQE